jgi:membrane protein YdbS with pleckstrin-like domain
MDEYRISSKFFWYTFAGTALMGLLLLVIIVGFFLLVGLIPLYIYYKTTKIVVSEDGLRYQTGLLTKTSKTIPWGKVNSVDSQISWFNRLLGSGNVKISIGNDVDGIKLKGVERPDELVAQIRAKSS